MSSPNNAIQIYVRSPNSTIPNDYHITTTPEDNIASVKQKIHDTLEVQPNVEDQRLIFQGKILSDQDLIKNVLKKVDQSMPQIFHLVVKSGLTTEPLAQTITPVNQPQSSYGINSTNSFFRHRFQSQFDSSFENSFFQSAPVPLPTGPNFNTPISQNTPVHPYLATTLGLPPQYQYVLIK
ncbi:hypothetical protein K7432_000441 [Basidiobolus ranarum]|uniref:Ubiquitin-like domain-containing protein n=1 Tax=Basidiobolus ranarum TaxID=34480 RepID=A0ABR2WB88_9FUNG